MRIKKTILWQGVLALGLILACHSWGLSQNASEGPQKIMFINLLFEQDDSGNRSIALVNSKVTDGKLKDYKQRRATTKSGALLLEPGKILCSVLDQNGQVIKQMMINDPLIKTLEYPTENGQMETASVQMYSDQCSIRLPFSGSYDALKLEKIKDDLTLKELQTVKL